MDLLDKDITVLRVTDAGYNSLGEYVVNERQQFTVKGRITKKQMAREHNPELLGRDLQGSINVLTREIPLKTVDTSDLKKADIVVHDGVMYEIFLNSGKQELLHIHHYRHVAYLLEAIEDISGTIISGDPFRPNKIEVSENSTVKGTQNEVNFIAGNGIDIDVINDDVNGKVDVILNNTVSGGSGNTFAEIVMNEDIEAFKVVLGNGYKANSNNIGHRNRVVGVTVESINNTFSGNYAYTGTIQNSLWNWIVGEKVFLNGENLSQTAPNTGFVISLGKATKTNEILIEISDSILL